VDFDQIQNPMINSDFLIGSPISVLSCDEKTDRGKKPEFYESLSIQEYNCDMVEENHI
jgi:hypothetical protein